MPDIIRNILGLDLGQTGDPAAIAFLQQRDQPLETVRQVADPLQCLVTKKRIDPDKWPTVMGIPKPCKCRHCQAVHQKLRAGSLVLSDLKSIEVPSRKPPPGELTHRLHPHLAGDPAFDLAEEKGWLPCEPCRGTGQIDITRCDTCKGSGRIATVKPPVEWYYDCRMLRRWSLGTDYTVVAGDVRKACQHPIIKEGQSVLVVDAGGPGRPFIDLLRRLKIGLRIVPITTTGGKKATVDLERVSVEFKVPKSELVFLFEIALEQQRLGFAANQPEVESMLQEMREFKMKQKPSGYQTFEAEAGAHDDRVMAIANALWFGERGTRKVQVW